MIACVKRRRSSCSIPQRFASARSAVTPIRARISSVSALFLSAMPPLLRSGSIPRLARWLREEVLVPRPASIHLERRQPFLDPVEIGTADRLVPWVDASLVHLGPELEVLGLLDRLHERSVRVKHVLQLGRP